MHKWGKLSSILVAISLVIYWSVRSSIWRGGDKLKGIGPFFKPATIFPLLEYIPTMTNNQHFNCMNRGYHYINQPRVMSISSLANMDLIYWSVLLSSIRKGYGVKGMDVGCRCFS